MSTSLEVHALNEYRKCNEAIGHLDNAYEHNENRGAFGGHAERAKELLQQAKHEIEEADEFRNEGR